ncbi:hypothetical protein STEG23_021100, partial [Scotinomys teguina]
EDYDRLRPLSYPMTDVFLICFSVVNPASFQNVKEEWVPELKEYAPNVPFLLIGTQIDLRDDPKTLARLNDMKEKPVCVEQGQKLAKEVSMCCCLNYDFVFSKLLLSSGICAYGSVYCTDWHPAQVSFPLSVSSKALFLIQSTIEQSPYQPRFLLFPDSYSTDCGLYTREKKLGTVITPDTWKDGARNTTESGGRKLNENKALTSKKARFDPYGKNKFSTCRICKSSVHQPGSHYCQGCAYKKDTANVKVLILCSEFDIQTQNSSLTHKCHSS